MTLANPLTVANDVPSDLPGFFSLFRSAEPKVDAAVGPRSRCGGPRGDQGEDADETSDFVWALAYWPWL